jgi:chromate transporter
MSGSDMAAENDEAEARPPVLSYGALFLKFLRFGLLAFGGPVAQIGMIRRDLVEREGWMSSERFNRLLAVMQALPGPEAHELCVHMGMRARGRIGGVLAGLGFMLPGLVLMLGLAWAYFLIDFDRPWIAGAMLAIQAVVIGLILRAVHRIGAHVLHDRGLWVLAIGAGAATLAGVSFWIVLPAAGAIHALRALGKAWLAGLVAALATLLAATMVITGSAPPLGNLALATADVAGPGDAAVWVIFLSGLKAGLLTFGGAYTAIPFMRQDMAGRGWISDGQFLDGVALAGVLPAPLIIFATFVGYVAGGFSGALAMTAGVFLPAFAFSLIFYDRLESLLDVKAIRSLLDGVTAGVVGLIAATSLQLAAGVATEASSAGRVAVLAMVALLGLVVAYRWKSGWSVPAVIGLAGLIGAGLLGR